MNIIDFILNQGGKSFAELPFSPTDAAVLCQLSYLKFEAVNGGKTTLLLSMSAPERDRLFEDSRFGVDQRRLYFEAAFSRRYQNMKILRAECVMNEKNDVGFCGFLFAPEGCAPCVVFRGTDEYIVGWKEDFEMAYRFPIPSQTLSVGFLRGAAEAIEGDFYICGHSKGGNLAEYSYRECFDELGGRVKMVYDLDGPGFANAEPAPDRSKIMKLVPEKSLVGQLFQSDGIDRRIESEGPGILQHDIFNWHVDKFGDFVYLEDGDGSYKLLTDRLNANISRLSMEQIEAFVEALFGIFKDADVTNLVEFSKHWLKNGKKMIEAYIDLDEDTRGVLTDTVADLIMG